MRNLKIIIEYDGTAYCGWQVQNSSRKRSIQETIEKALRKILQENIKIIASGRTDAGVHARAQVANFKTKSKISTDKLQAALNGNLPKDIVITAIEEVASGFHSRFNAKSKLYRYIILNRSYPSALLKDKVYFFRYPLNVALMREEAKALLGKHDFKAFCASSSSAKDTVRRIKKIVVKSLPADSKDGSRIVIDIEANGFLYNMVRNITGALVEAGRGKFPKGSLKRILAGKDRKLAGPALPACGLSLVQVKY